MTLVLDLTPEQEAHIRDEAERIGMPITEFALQRLLGRDQRRPDLERRLSAEQLLAMPRDDRSPYLRAAAEDAAHLYCEDLSRPPAERELTALTLLDGEPYHEYE